MLNVAAWEPRSIVNGPGERFVLWVQGCPFRCPNCYNDSFLPFERRKEMTIEEIAEIICGTDGIEGVTFSGGEPMAQPRGLFELSLLLRVRGLTIMSYTGYTLEELRASKNPWTARFLDVIDILVDGRFELERRGSMPWRGSDNQQVHFLSDRYRHLNHLTQTPRQDVEMIIRTDEILSTGIVHEEILANLAIALQQGGMS